MSVCGVSHTRRKTGDAQGERDREREREKEIEKEGERERERERGRESMNIKHMFSSFPSKPPPISAGNPDRR